MTSKEKAKELFNRMYFSEDEEGFHSINKYRAKQCALIAVDEILNLCPLANRDYWEEVKKEIELL